jgi:hypothetical protein
MPHIAWPEVGPGSSRRYLQLCGLAGEIPVGNFPHEFKSFPAFLNDRNPSFPQNDIGRKRFLPETPPPPAVPVMPLRACDACKARKVKVRTQSTEHSLDPAQEL